MGGDLSLTLVPIDDVEEAIPPSRLFGLALAVHAVFKHLTLADGRVNRYRLPIAMEQLGSKSPALWMIGY